MSWFGWILVVLVFLAAAMLGAQRLGRTEAKLLVRGIAAVHGVELVRVEIQVHWLWPFRKAIGFDLEAAPGTDHQLMYRLMHDVGAELDQRFGSQK